VVQPARVRPAVVERCQQRLPGLRQQWLRGCGVEVGHDPSLCRGDPAAGNRCVVPYPRQAVGRRSPPGRSFVSRRTPRRLALALLPVAAVALSGCQSNGLTREGMPPAVTVYLGMTDPYRTGSGRACVKSKTMPRPCAEASVPFRSLHAKLVTWVETTSHVNFTLSTRLRAPIKVVRSPSVEAIMRADGKPRLTLLCTI